MLSSTVVGEISITLAASGGPGNPATKTGNAANIATQHVRMTTGTATSNVND